MEELTGYIGTILAYNAPSTTTVNSISNKYMIQVTF